VGTGNLRVEWLPRRQHQSGKVLERTVVGALSIFGKTTGGKLPVSEVVF
jgi:hypothetical protein